MLSGIAGLGLLAIAVRPARGRYDWSRRAPKTKTERMKMPASCFLGAGRKYPICPAGTRGRQIVDCEGVRAAYSRARQYHRSAIAEKALRKAKRAKCGWAA